MLSVIEIVGSARHERNVGKSRYTIRMSTAYHPQTAEKGSRIIERVIRRTRGDEQEWIEVLSVLEFARGRATRSSTRGSPLERTYDHNPVRPVCRLSELLCLLSGAALFFQAEAFYGEQDGNCCGVR